MILPHWHTLLDRRAESNQKLRQFDFTQAIEFPASDFAATTAGA
jgi:hypothetical protein